MRTFILALLLGAIPLQARAAAIANGVDEPPRRGTYVETSLGVFTTMGGSVGLSNGQPYLSMTLGHELGEQATVFFSLGIGAASASCYAKYDASTGICSLGADSFGATFVEGGVSYGLPIVARTLLSLKMVAGLTDLSPAPVEDGSTVGNHLFGFHLGTGLSIDYDTHLEHFAVGFDALFRYTLAHYTPSTTGVAQTLGLPSLAVMPRVRYVF